MSTIKIDIGPKLAEVANWFVIVFFVFALATASRR